MKRWIIRSFFIGLLLLFVGGWAGSTFYQWELWCQYIPENSFDHYTCDFCTDYGVTRFHWGYMSDSHVPGAYWSSYLRRLEDFHLLAEPDTPRWDHFIGFDYHHENDDPHARWSYGFSVPYWFLILLSAALLWLVWRKTRLPVKGRAFPVELEKKNEMHSPPTPDTHRPRE